MLQGSAARVRGSRKQGESTEGGGFGFRGQAHTLQVTDADSTPSTRWSLSITGGSLRPPQHCRGVEIAPTSAKKALFSSCLSLVPQEDMLPNGHGPSVALSVTVCHVHGCQGRPPCSLTTVFFVLQPLASAACLRKGPHKRWLV